MSLVELSCQSYAVFGWCVSTLLRDLLGCLDGMYHVCVVHMAGGAGVLLLCCGPAAVL